MARSKKPRYMDFESWQNKKAIDDYYAGSFTGQTKTKKPKFISYI